MKQVGTRRFLYVCAGVLFPMLLTSATALAQIPLTINHQGIVHVDGTPFHGVGEFRFSLVDLGTGNNVWTNDGSQVGLTDMPTAPVTLGVTEGLYSVQLGDTSLTNMLALPASIFANGNVIERTRKLDSKRSGLSPTLSRPT